MTREHVASIRVGIAAIKDIRAGVSYQAPSLRAGLADDAARLSEVAAMIEAMVSERERLQPIAELTEVAMIEAKLEGKL